MSNEGFKFACPFCSQHIRAFEEHIGYEVNCPTCGELLIVPELQSPVQEVYPVESYGNEESHGFAHEDWERLQEEQPEVVETILKLDRHLSWECGAAAALLDFRLGLLNDAIAQQSETYYHPATQAEHIAFLNHIDQRAAEFFDIMNFIYRLITKEFQRISVHNNLLSLLDFADQMGREIGRLRALHDVLFEHSLPQEQPFPEIQRLMLKWVPAVRDGLADCIKQLNDKAPNVRGDWGDARVNVTLFPTSLPNFFILKNQLIMRYGNLR